jgi:hypothetical protein
MSEYLSTIGNSSIAIAICGRCSLKFAIVDLQPDPNSPGLMVCGTPSRMTGKGTWTGGTGCMDMYDPYRLPPHETEDITLEYPRPDTRLPIPPYISVAPGDPNWPPSQFPDDGLQAAQLPPTGVIPFIPGQPVYPPNALPGEATANGPYSGF